MGSRVSIVQATGIHARSGTFSGSNNLALFAVPPAQLPSGTIIGDPLLLPLADNRGPTLTHALAAGSAAIDSGNNTTGQTYDQRGVGFARTIGAGPTSVPTSSKPTT